MVVVGKQACVRVHVRDFTFVGFSREWNLIKDFTLVLQPLSNSSVIIPNDFKTGYSNSCNELPVNKDKNLNDAGYKSLYSKYG